MAENDVLNMIKGQTDYSDEIIIAKMKEHNNNYMSIIREYLSASVAGAGTSASTSVAGTSVAGASVAGAGPSVAGAGPSVAGAGASASGAAAGTSTSVNQTIYREIRHLMDDAAKSYSLKKELEKS